MSNTILFPASKHFNFEAHNFNEETLGNPEQRQTVLDSIFTSICMLKARIEANDDDLPRYLEKARKDHARYKEILESWEKQDKTATYINLGV